MTNTEIPLAVPLAAWILLLAAADIAVPQPRIRAHPTTYCNPMNLDYAFIPAGHTDVT